MSILFLRAPDWSPKKQLAFDLFTQQAKTNRPFKFQKRSQHYIRVHNETLSVAPPGARSQRRLFVCRNPQLRHTQLQPALLRLSAMIPSTSGAVLLNDYSERFAIQVCSIQAVRSLFKAWH
jgi:hypothetical protein